MALPTAIAGADQTIAEAALPTSKSFNGAASTPGAGGNSIATYVWTLIDKPAGSAASLAGATTATPTLNNIDTWGNYRIKLVVTDNLGASSETNELKMPDSAFVHVRVTAEKTSLQKPAKGERNTQDLQRAVVGAVETLRKDVDDFQFADLADINQPGSTGPRLERLLNAGLATSNGLAGGQPLHTHPAGQMGVATQALAGAVALAEAPADPAAPTVPVHDEMWLTATLVGEPSVTIKPRWRLPYAVTIIAASVYLRDAGTIAAGTYKFDVVASGGQATVTVPTPAQDGGASSAVATGLSVAATTEIYFQNNAGSGGANGRDPTYLVCCRRV